MRTVENIIETEIYQLANELDQVLYEKCVDDYFEHWRNRDLETEVFQTWLITPWLADKLEELGEPVAKDFHGLYFWGRTCCGQAIIADGIFQKVWDSIQ